MWGSLHNTTFYSFLLFLLCISFFHPAFISCHLPFLFTPHCCCNPPSMHTVACQLHGFLLEPHPLCVCVCVCGKGGGWLFQRWLLIRIGHSTKWWGERSLQMHVVQITSGRHTMWSVLSSFLQLSKFFYATYFVREKTHNRKGANGCFDFHI